ncbi:hypothetical protein HDU99_006262 [Rhizoclosmatium hyalinum]|nr:hypothetical protein HDU99_006262 [Rhizoclosmatium hyalinum]
MNARSACPKCEGYGFIHDTVDKHDKRTLFERCKKCNDCNICGGSGIVVGKTACKTCKARGFIHPNSAPSKHPFNNMIACVDCIECKDCVRGIPRHIAKQLPRASPGQQDQTWDPSAIPDGSSPARGKSTLIGSSPFFDSLFTSDSAHFQSKKLLQSKHQTAQQTLVNVVNDAAFSEALKKTIDCPRCAARGWKHESTARHDKKDNIRCKSCINCKACQGKGKVDEDTIPCTSCELSGFFHPVSDERPHDAPPNLRCFYCQVCQNCKGVGVTVVIKKKQLTPQRQPSQPVPVTPPFVPATNPVNAPTPAQPQVPPNIPAPPVLAVVMVKDPSNPGVQIPMVDLPGIGLVPAEQILKMQVPMVVMPAISPPRPQVAPPQGNPQTKNDTHVVDEQELMETSNIVKQVWG